MNSLEDFAIAMNMYTIAQIPISQGHFIQKYIALLFYRLVAEEEGILSHKEV